MKYSNFVILELLLDEHYVELLLKGRIFLIYWVGGGGCYYCFAYFRNWSNLAENCPEDWSKLSSSLCCKHDSDLCSLQEQDASTHLSLNFPDKDTAERGPGALLNWAHTATKEKLQETKYPVQEQYFSNMEELRHCEMSVQNISPELEASIAEICCPF